MYSEYEADAGKSANENVSILWEFLQALKKDFPEVQHLHIWADNSACQNKCWHIIKFYQNII